MEYIETLERPYNLLLWNSNSMVYSALKACGITLSWSGGINNHFGWGYDLINPMSMPSGDGTIMPGGGGPDDQIVGP